MRDLTGPGDDDPPMFSWAEYGVPARFLTVSTEGCFEDRTTAMERHSAGLVVDVLAFAGIGSAAYGFTLRRGRRLGNRDVSENEPTEEE